MERETNTFKTKSGVEVVMNTYLTGRESRNMTDCYLQGAEVKTSGVDKDMKATIEGLKMSDMSKAQDISIEALIVSINGQTEKTLDLVLDLPEEDFNEIVIEINKITSVKKEVSDTSKA